MKENKSDYKDLSIKEMTDKEFSNFLRWKEEIVYGEMGCNPTEECLVGMWEMWKYLHKPIDEDQLDDQSYDVGEKNPEYTGMIMNMMMLKYSVTDSSMVCCIAQRTSILCSFY